ncbi:MAG: dehydrogenase, partial [Verrucomicrobia bacterium]|nr:dehydrogenase [Verrucomicrobiota bacterium]
MKSLLNYFRHFVSGLVLLVACVSSFPLAAAENTPKKVVFLIGEQEYQTAETLPRFAREELIPCGIDCQFAIVSEVDPNDFAGLNNLADADLLVVSVRRRTPPSSQMKLIKDYLDRGGAVMGIRTSTHAFDREPPASGHVRWEHFDNEVF